MSEQVTSRRRWQAGLTAPPPAADEACEGGCGVIGVIASEPVAGRHLHQPLSQMNNRGNGKGGGIAVVGCFPARPRHYALHVALLDPAVRGEVESRFVEPLFEVAACEEVATLDDHRAIGRLELRPPDVVRYFVRAREDALARFAEETGISVDDGAESELVFRNSYELNLALYAAGSPRAFVLSHGRNLMILKGVGFAEDLLRYYRLEDVAGRVWIGHQRYPTRGRVWHPGGAHPFAGLDEALVHNGDLANYAGIAEYLGQRGLRPLFQTDTEAAALLFDLYNRTYGYRLEHTIEALAPTTERDFDLLPKDKQRIYRALQASHLHGSPDGPFFFILARSLAEGSRSQLIGITDTSMLRPQVFALHHGDVGIGLIASEKQAIDAYLASLSAEDGRVAPEADSYWNARGGSHTDGGAFVFSTNGRGRLRCHDKFGKPVDVAPRTQPRYPVDLSAVPDPAPGDAVGWPTLIEAAGATVAFEEAARRAKAWSFDELRSILRGVVAWVQEAPAGLRAALEFLTLLLDQRYDPGDKKRSSVRVLASAAIDELLDALPAPGAGDEAVHRRVDAATAGRLGPPPPGQGLLALDASGLAVEGRSSAARLLVRAHELGWRHLVVYRCRGHRFLGCGLGPGSRGTEIDVYGASGDYLGSGIDGAEVQVHGDAQDQIGQVLKSGRIVVHGSVGQTLLYGAKGGEVFIRGNTAGRPLINAVGNVRVVVNGTCLDYAAESFMAGPPTGGGYLVINGVTTLPDGRVYGLETKYPGTNLFSLSSGGCCYLNDPYRTVPEEILNGARFHPFLQEDWNVLEPALRDNERFFRIHTRYDLLMVDGVLRWPREVFRKVVPASAPAPVE